MKLLITSIILTSIITINTSTFQKAIGTNGVDNGKIILNAPDGYVIVGEKSSDDHIRKELLIYKTDKSGTLIWSKSYGGAETYVVNDAYLDSQQHLHLSSERYLNKRESLIYIETDENGNIVNSKPYDEDGNEVEPWAISSTQNGGNLIVGFTKTANIVPGGFYNASIESKHLYLLKTNHDGSKVWSKKLILPQESASNAYDIVKTSSNEFFVLGQIKEATTLQNILFKIDDNGVVAWSKKINETNLILRNIELLKSGELILTGFCEGNNSSTDNCLIKINTQGDIIWSKRYGKDKDENCKGLASNSDEIIFTSTTKSFNSTAEQILVSSIDYNGNLNWTNKYGSGVLEDVSNPILDQYQILFSGFSLRTSNGAETLLIKINKQNNLQKQVAINSANFPISTQDIQLNFETLNTNSFGGIYSINDTQVTPLNLSSININI